MTEQTVRTVFSKYVAGDDLILSPISTVPITTFTTLFQSATSVPPSYAELSAIDAGNMGYASFFSQAKTDGVIS